MDGCGQSNALANYGGFSFGKVLAVILADSLSFLHMMQNLEVMRVKTACLLVLKFLILRLHF